MTYRNASIRPLFWTAVALAAAMVLWSVPSVADDGEAQDNVETSAGGEDLPFEVPDYKRKNRVQLRRSLTAIQYNVTQQDGTEPAFRNLYWDNKKEGLYRCVVCQYPLFTSDTKFKSGTGWPSFYAPLSDKMVASKRDWKMLYPRTEVHCARCKAHLGHVFDDGPAPTGKRFCMNSASLKFEETELPENPVTVPGTK